jgi:hypothetical protein
MEQSRKGDLRATQALIALKREADEALARERKAQDAEQDAVGDAAGDIAAEDDEILADYLRQMSPDGSAS